MGKLPLFLGNREWVVTIYAFQYDPSAYTTPPVSSATNSPRTATTILFPRSSCGLYPSQIKWSLSKFFSWPPLPSLDSTPVALPPPTDQVSGKAGAGSLHRTCNYPPLPPHEIIMWQWVRPSRWLLSSLTKYWRDLACDGGWRLAWALLCYQWYDYGCRHFFLIQNYSAISYYSGSKRNFL